MSVRLMKLVPGAVGSLLVLLSVLACTAMPVRPQPQVTTPQEVPPGMVVLVGRTELHPPLQPGEQSLKTAAGEELENTFILYCGDRLMDFNEGNPTSYVGSFSTTLEKDFFIKVRRDPLLYVSGGTFYAAYDPPLHIESHTFSSPLRVELRPDDKAVYIGTIQYYRDQFNKVKSVMIRDDYQWAESQYQERFGAQNPLRKSLVTFMPATNK